MNIDEMRTEWKQYSKKLEVSQRLNEHLIQSMLKERSRSRVSKIRRNNAIYLVLMVITTMFLAAIFFGNPFDFRYRLQYIPYGILFIGVLLGIVSLVKSLKNFTSTNINNVSLDSFLKRTIAEYEKNKKLERWVGIIIFSAGLLTAFSFLPKKLEHKEFWQAVGETAISMLITIAIYFIAFKMGAFKNKNQEEFENDLKEWNELKTISMELNDK